MAEEQLVRSASGIWLRDSTAPSKSPNTAPSSIAEFAPCAKIEKWKRPESCCSHLASKRAASRFFKYLLRLGMSPRGPYRLMTVNTAPDRAKRVIGAMVENLKESYTIDYVVNSERESSKSPFLENWT
ncbi:hypothetical protein FPOA_03389 [Fusarium poae]|uniref:Uncharacterized protein n=1 Tax=Fusarium poae TaxID=36050 RepID=A0A1B8B9Q7_FUSPO|nr:hypothetical protein FPOA_03389 [Fusarium poae]